MLSSAEEVVQSDLDAIAARTGAELRCLEGSSLLLTGGGGFLGHYLVQSVLHWNEHHAVEPIRLTVFDNWIRGMPGWLKPLADDPHLELVTADITNPLPANMAPHEWIIHAASIASPTFYRKHPIETMDANVSGLRNLLEYARHQKQAGESFKGFLFYSTSEIYGDPDPENIPTAEDYRGNVSCTGPRACYDESKRYGETLCVAFAHVHDLPVRVARPFNNYGPGLRIDDRRVLPDFVRDALAGRDIVMLSSGTPTRTFCYISDAVSGYLKILVNGRNGEAYNIGTEAPEISIAKLADLVTQIARNEFDYRGKLVKRTSDDPDYLVDNPNRRCPDISKARTEIGYDPVVGLEDGLRRALLWYRDNSLDGGD